MSEFSRLLEELSKELHIVDNPFQEAVMNEDINEIKRLVKEKCSLNTHYTLGLTPLHSAVRFGKSISFIKSLLELGSDPNLTEQREGRSPLYDAVWGENEPLVSLLLEYGANPNIRDKDKWTALFCAAWRGHESIAKTLINYNADKAAKDIYQKTPATKAIENNQLGVHHVLSTYNSTYPATLKKMIRLVRKGNEEELETALADGFPINLGNENGETLLTIAVKAGKAKIVDVLLMYGAKVNRFDFKGNTALFYAIKMNRQEIMHILLDHRAFPSMQTIGAMAPLDLYNVKGNGELTSLLNEQVKGLLEPDTMFEPWTDIELESQEIEILSQDIMQGDIIIDRLISNVDMKVRFLLPRSEMGNSVVVSVQHLGNGDLLARPDVELPYGKKIKVLRNVLTVN